MEEIDSQFDLAYLRLSSIASKLEFKCLCEFNLQELDTIVWDKLNVQGIYLFEIRNNELYEDFPSWVQNFTDEWHDERYRKRFVSNIKAKRIRAHTELQTWIPLYIGKSKNIRERVHDHIFKGLEQTTFAMKLAAREHLKKETLRLSFIEVETAHYDWVMPVLERMLRDRINPIIGKQ